LKKQIKTPPRIGVLTGTGIGDCIQTDKINESFQYNKIPNFPVSTVEGHAGNLIFGNIGNKPAIMMQGRFHLYEGYTPLEVTFPIRVMQELGVKELIVLNASGGIHPAFTTGDMMIITDHINLTGENPLLGPNEETWGIRFPEMTQAYDKSLSGLAEASGKETGIKLQKGVYAGLKGPSLETPAEIRFLKTIGADTVGFSTVQEVIAAVHGGMKVLGISIITNINDPDNPIPATLEEVIKVAESVSPKIDTIIQSIAGKLDEK
ncbi:MAG: purine-nucleoside phosphorylase, partial [Desulfobacterales bacterium]|nr:purine-nucleoside phosphorylase [Desulfobacterales bacterium]